MLSFIHQTLSKENIKSLSSINNKQFFPISSISHFQPYSTSTASCQQAGLWWADETISAHCWRWHIHGVRSWPRRLVDGVALILDDENHCLESYKSEVEGR